MGLTVTVTVGMTLGLWMVFMAVTVATTSPQASSGAGHVETQAAPAHGHSDAGVVPMPGLEPVAPTPSTASGMAHAGSDNAADIAGMGAEEMAGMSDEDMAAMGHTADAHTPAAGEGESGRPLGATLAGFGFVNVAVLICAFVIGRRRARRHRSGRPQGTTPSRETAATGTGAAQGASTFATESAGSPT